MPARALRAMRDEVASAEIAYAHVLLLTQLVDTKRVTAGVARPTAQQHSRASMHLECA